MSAKPGVHRRILVTSALPYSNGPIHLGHLFENIQTDIWVRFQRLVGNQCIYVCAEDAHGTATMLKAEEEGMTPEEWGEAMRASHAADFAGFHIAHDNFYSTHSDENRHYSELIFGRLQEKGHIFTEGLRISRATTAMHAARHTTPRNSRSRVPSCRGRHRS